MSDNVVPFEKPKPCPMCEGSGKYRIIGPGAPHGSLLITCDHCGGVGHLTKKKEEENAKALEKFLKE